MSFALEHFAISAQFGFLKEMNLRQLPETCDFHRQLNKIINALPHLLKTKTLRQTIQNLDAAFSAHPLPLEEPVTAMILIFLTQAYIWEEESEPANLIPSVLGKHLYAVAKNQQRFPTLTYADYILQNWCYQTPNRQLSIDTIKPLFTFTDSQDEAWFILIHVMIEAACGQALAAALAGHEYALSKQKNESHFIASFKSIQQALSLAIHYVRRMEEKCDPDYYYCILRPYLMGFSSVKVGDEVGIRFASVPTRDKKPSHAYGGASGAASSILPALDAFLGIKHDIDSMYQVLLQQQQFMPQPHQLFIHYLRMNPLAQVLKEQPNLFHEYQKTVLMVREFRREHLLLVETYIHKPAARAGKWQETVGTGGTPFKSYLANRYHATQVTPAELAMEACG